MLTHHTDEIRKEARRRLLHESTLPLDLPEDTSRLVEELRIAYAELELQNEELQRAYSQLDLSKRQYESLFQQAPAAYFVLDGQGVIRELNEAASALLHRDRPYLTNRPFLGLMIPADRAFFTAQLQRLFQGVEAHLSGDLRLYRSGAGSSVLYTRFQASLVKGSESSPDLCRMVISDQSELRNTEMALQERTLFYEALFNSTSDAILLSDNQGRYVEANPAASKLLGYSKRELLQMTVSDLVEPAFRDQVESNWNQFLREGNQAGQIRLRRQDGGMVTVDYTAAANVKPGVHMTSLRDLKDRLAATEAERKLASIVNLAPLAIYTYDENGLIRSWNHMAETLYGYPAGYVLGESIEVLSRSEQDWHPTSSLGDQESHFFEDVHIRRDGTTFPVEVRTVVLPSPAGEVQVAVLVLDLTERIEREHRMRLLERVVDESPIGITIADARKPDQPLIYVNHGFEQISGYASEEILGQNCRFLQGEDRSQTSLQPIRASLKDGSQCKVLLRNYKRDGTLFWNEFAMFSMADANGDIEYFVGFQNDVTQVHVQREALEHLRKAVEEAQEALVQFTVPKLHPSLGASRIGFANPAFAALAGCAPQALVGKPFPDFQPDADAPRLTDALEHAIARHETLLATFATQVRGRVLWLEVSLTYVTDPELPGDFDLALLIRDTTARVERIWALKKQQALLDGLIQSALDGILVFDANMNLVLSNEAATTLFGIRHDPDMPFSLELLFPASQREQLATEFGELLDPNVPPSKRRISYVVERSDQDRIPVEIAVSEIAFGDQPQYVLIARDNTERNAYMRGLVLARNAAEELERFKSNLLANVSHEIRTPITIILGYAQLLNEVVGDSEREFVQAIKEAGDRLMNMLATVMDIAQAHSNLLHVDAYPVEIDSLMESEAAHWQHLAERKGIELVLEASASKPVALADNGALSRALFILLDNAVKFTDEGSITLSFGVEQETVWVRVADTGQGIRPEFLPRLMEPFRQQNEGLRRTHDGLGLGLALLFRLMSLMNGSVHVHSEVGKGSSFTLRLPRMQDASFSVTPLRVPEREILVLEEGTHISKYLKQHLGEASRITSLRALEDAVALLAEEHFDLILISDSYVFSDGKPDNVLDNLRHSRNGRHVKVVLLSSFSTDLPSPEDVSAGMHVVHRPLTRAQLQKIVSEP